MNDTTAILILLIAFLVMIVLRFPIAYAVAIASILCMLYRGDHLAVLPMQMIKGIFSFSLMAVPFFITMGVLMGTGGISEKLIALEYRGFLLLRRHFRFRGGRYRFSWNHSDPHDG